MDRDTLLHQLRAWADGHDPATGEMLPADHPAQQPATLRVVFAALTAIEAQSSITPAAGRDPFPGLRNAGRAWSPSDEQALADAFDAGESIGALATRFERTRGAINARLVRLGKIELPPRMRLRGEPSVAGEARSVRSP